MKREHKMVAAAAVVASLMGGVAFAAGKQTLDFPKNYRDWAHAKSMVIPDKANGLYGFHHVYVSPNARKAYQEGKFPLPESSTLVVPFYEVETKDGATHQGPLRMVAVMKKDKRATDTGGWWYGAFDPAGKALEMDVKQGCYTCHEPQKARDYVFSKWQ